MTISEKKRSLLYRFAQCEVDAGKTGYVVNSTLLVFEQRGVVVSAKSQYTTFCAMPLKYTELTSKRIGLIVLAVKNNS